MKSTGKHYGLEEVPFNNFLNFLVLNDMVISPWSLDLGRVVKLSGVYSQRVGSAIPEEEVYGYYHHSEELVIAKAGSQLEVLMEKTSAEEILNTR